MARRPELQRLTAKELATWVPASQAIKQAERAFGDFKVAAGALVGCLKIGSIRSGAAFAGIDGAGKLSDAVEISPQHWGGISHAEKEDLLWRANQLAFMLHGQRDVMGNLMTPSEILRYQGVALEPTSLTAFLGSVAAPEAAATPAAPASRTRKGHVTEAQMKHWYAAFKAVYGGTPNDTLPFAEESARGFFPEKAVTRDDVRKAMAADGPRKPGPKSKRPD